MNNKDQNISEYILNLPESVQDFVFNGIWEEKTIEIGKKYNLNEKQIDDLANNVVLVLIGVDKPETFLETIVKELEISKIIGEQIVEDLEKRVFDYALKAIEPKPITKLENKPETSVANEIKPVFASPPVKPIVPPIVKPVIPPAPQVNSKIPEIRPANLPSSQIAKPIETTPPVQKSAPVVGNIIPKINIPTYIHIEKPIETPAVTTDVKKEVKPEVKPNNTQEVKISYKPTGLGEGISETPKSSTLDSMPTGDSRIKYTPTVAPISTPTAPEVKIAEPVQRTTAVPRFNALADEVAPQTPTTSTPSPSSIIDSKLNTVSTDKKEEVKETPKETPIVKQYTVDPYREPLS